MTVYDTLRSAALNIKLEILLDYAMVCIKLHAFEK